MLFGTLLSFTCFSQVFLVHCNRNVLFYHVAFLQLIRYGNLYRKCLNKANVYFLNITIISYIPQIHKIVFTIEMFQVNGWETLSLQLLFPIFFFFFFLKKVVWLHFPVVKKEIFNLLDYFGMGIIEEISFFFL